MRHIKFFDKDKETYALKDFLHDGHQYSKGDLFDSSNLPKRQLERLFGLWFIGHQEDSEKRLTRLSGLYTGATTILPETTPEPELEGEVESEDEELTEDLVEIVEDTPESFKVKYKDQVRELKRNQVREDGTLTKGGLKAFS